MHLYTRVFRTQSFSGRSANFVQKKKVLLRERKRHTARRVASARYADLSGGGYPISGPGGYPIPCLGGTPSQVVGGVHRPRSWGGTLSHVQGVPHPRSGGYPIPGLGGVPHPKSGVPLHHLDLAGVPPSDLRWGTPQHLDLAGVPPGPEMGYPADLRYEMGYPPGKCEQTENITFPHPSDGGR